MKVRVPSSEQMARLLAMIHRADDDGLKQIARQLNPQVVAVLLQVAQQVGDPDLIAKLQHIQALQSPDDNG